MEKICPRCGAKFECKHEDIANCQCARVKLTAEARAWLQAHYGERCLCVDCLEELRRAELPVRN